MTDELVSVDVPATSASMRVVRLVAAAVAIRAGMDVEEVEDLRIAVSELSSVLVEHAPDGGRLAVAFELAEGSLSVTGQVPGGRPPVADQLTTQIVSSLVDRFSLDGDGLCRFRMIRSLAPQPGVG